MYINLTPTTFMFIKNVYIDYNKKQSDYETKATMYVLKRNDTYVNSSKGHFVIMNIYGAQNKHVEV